MLPARLFQKLWNNAKLVKWRCGAALESLQKTSDGVTAFWVCSFLPGLLGYKLLTF